MNEKKDKKYYLGLDIGTSSVGFAVTDENYSLIKKQKKHLWGARLFDEASDASDRRLHRSARRRYQRRRARIVLLRTLFEEEVAKIDPNFFRRLDVSAIHDEDREKSLRAPFLLFNGDFTDAKYYNKFPTIYHLRKYLAETDEKADIRLIYLALAHMIKYRGNFLREGDVGNVAEDYDFVLQAFAELNDAMGLVPEYSDEDETLSFKATRAGVKSLLGLFKRNLGKGELVDEEKKIFDLSDKRLLELMQLINGSDKKAKTLFADLVKSNPEMATLNLSFDQEDYEGVLSASGLPDDYLNLLFAAKKIYDVCLLTQLLHGKAYISDAMVDIYESHKKQLKELKSLYKQLAPEKYKAFFDEMPPKNDKNKQTGLEYLNYAAYVGVLKVKGRKKTIATTRYSSDLAPLYKKIREDLDIEGRLADKNVDEKLKKRLVSIDAEMNAGVYLRIQNNKSNGVFPYQLNKNEMKRIIEKQKKHYPFLGEMAPSFIDPENKMEYKIVSILEYKVPYFVGPLKAAEKPSDNRWVVFSGSNDRKEPITPWNFYEKIDAAETAKGFMDRLKNNCTYLYGETTLPKFSLTYLQYLIFNELNCVYKNENIPLSPFDKQFLFDNYYKTHKKISIREMERKLSELYNGQKIKLRPRSGGEDDEKLSDTLKTSYSSYVELSSSKGLGVGFDQDEKGYEKAEAIIYLVTVFEDKKQLRKQLKALDGGFTDEQIQYFSSLKFKDWGRLSEKLLTGSNGRNAEEAKILSNPVVLPPDQTSAMPRSILDLLKYTSKNFNEIYFDSGYGFADKVEAYNKSVTGEDMTIGDFIDESYGSPAVKRALRQTMGIIDELKRILGIDDFDRIFVECTRQKEKDPKKKSSRKKNLQSLYKSAEALVKEENAALSKAELQGLKAKLDEREDDDLRAKKVFYYFAQFGRDVYSGEPIDLENLKDYDIDHIIPQSIVKDDSFLNTVLTRKDINNKKSNTYPFNDDSHCILTQKGIDWVIFLNRIHKNDYMSDEKRNHILRKSNLSPDELEGFVKRQIVTTNQTVKTVCDILKKVSKAKIVYSKASNVSEFRNVFDLIKLRDLNDFHHANDAYLNIVVGNVYDQKFSTFSKKWIEEQLRNDSKFQCGIDVLSVFVKTKTGQNQKIIANRLTGQVAWISQFDEEEAKKQWRNRDPLLMKGTIEKIRKTLSWNDPMITQALRTQKGKQGFFNKITIKKSLANSALIGEKKDGDSVGYPLKCKDPSSNPFSTGNWPEKYGYYTDMTSGYFYLVKSISKGETVYSIEAIPTIVFGNGIPKLADVEKWLEENCKLKEPKLVFDPSKKLLIRSVVEIPSATQGGKHGYLRLGISGKTGSSLIMINLSELHLPKAEQEYFKSIVKILGKSLPKGAKKDLSMYEKEMEAVSEGKHVLTAKQNIELYKYLVDHVYSLPEYENLPGGLAKRFKLTRNETLEKDRNYFEDLPVIAQAEVLFTMIKLLSCKSVQQQDLSALNSAYPKNAGLMTISKWLKPGYRIIEESKTGFYRRVLFEVK